MLKSQFFKVQFSWGDNFPGDLFLGCIFPRTDFETCLFFFKNLRKVYWGIAYYGTLLSEETVKKSCFFWKSVRYLLSWIKEEYKEFFCCLTVFLIVIRKFFSWLCSINFFCWFWRYLTLWNIWRFCHLKNTSVSIVFLLN